MSESHQAIFFIVCVLVLIFGLYRASDMFAAAADNQIILTIDEQTLVKGYTVKSENGDFMLPVLPGYFKNPLTIEISEVANSEPLPTNKKAVSDFYFYEVKPGYSGFLEKPIMFFLKFAGQSSAKKELYFFDNNLKKWRPLPTSVNLENGIARTQTLFPAAKVAVFADYEADGLSAVSAIVADSSGRIIYEKNSDEVRPLASLSKLMTALVFLDHNPGWDKKINMIADDNVGGASLPCQVGDSLTVRDLFYATLTGSKNNAAHALMRATGLPEVDFVNKMNEKARSWGLKNTFFVEPTGLSDKNISTAKEMLIISQKAFNSKDCLQATTQKWYKVSYSGSTESKIVWIQNTNKLLDRDLYITGGKTGYTEEAGYNLVSRAKNSSHELIALVLGCQNQKNYEEVYKLLKKYL